MSKVVPQRCSVCGSLAIWCRCPFGPTCWAPSEPSRLESPPPASVSWASGVTWGWEVRWTLPGFRTWASRRYALWSEACGACRALACVPLPGSSAPFPPEPSVRFIVRLRRARVRV